MTSAEAAASGWRCLRVGHVDGARVSVLGLRYSLAGRDPARAWVGRSSDDGWGRESSSVSCGSPGRRRRQNHRGSRQEEGT